MKNQHKFLLKDSYLSVIKNSIGSKIFRNSFTIIDGQKKDLLKNGKLSCAFFVSSILVIFKLIKEVHLTVDGTIKDLEKSGWKKVYPVKFFAKQKLFSMVKKLKIGSIILWEEKNGHKHLGFFIGKNQAISNAFYFYKKREPIIHHLTYNGRRKIEEIFWHKKLEK